MAKSKKKSNSENKAKDTTTIKAKASVITKKKKKSTKRPLYGVPLHKVLKQVHPEISISSKAMVIMDNFVIDIFERLAGEASKLCRVISKQRTLSSRDFQTAVRLLFPGELSKHAVSEGTKAVAKYIQSK